MNHISMFGGEGNWYKGNLHCHSTDSDGKLSPSEVAELYKKSWWNFLAFTDHKIFSDYEKFNDRSFLILPAAELDTHKLDPVRIYHVLGITGRDKHAANSFAHGELFESPVWNGLKSAQGIIDQIITRNAHAIFCHPNWSRLEFEDFRDLNGFFAMEIYNHCAEVESHTGISIDYWDSLLRRGRKIWGVATDDAHHHLKDQCGGWVMVRASCLSHESIMEALLDGCFYSSNGPEIYHYGIKDGVVYVECSPVRAIHFVTYELHGCSYWGADEGTINSASYKLKGSEKYVRVECVDKQGHTAWSNPIFLENTLCKEQSL